MKRFLTPDEQRLLDALPPQERAVVRDLFELLDARLVGSVSPIVLFGEAA